MLLLINLFLSRLGTITIFIILKTKTNKKQNISDSNMLSRNITKIIKTVHTLRFQNANNYYEVLGLNPNAQTGDIKKKYYQLAKIYHPDVSKEADSHIKFNRITIAYQTLTDQNKRREYDQQNPYFSNPKNNRNSSAPNQNHTKNQYQGYKYRSHKQKSSKFQQDEDPFMAYDQYFKSNRVFNKPKRGTDININLTITLQQSILGVKKQVSYTQQQLCSHCSSVDKQICYTCGGKRTIFNRIKREKQQCSGCNGKGFSNQCEHCNGQSYVSVDVKQTVYISKNSHNKNILRMEGLGHHGFKSDNGDLYITVFVQQSPLYKIDGNNVHSQHHLDYLTAILGGKVTIETVYGGHEVEIDPGTQSGKQVRLNNLGLNSKYSKRKGDHIVKFMIKVPNKCTLTEKQKQLIQSLNL